MELGRIRRLISRIRASVGRLVSAAWAFFRTLALSLAAETRYRFGRMTFFRLTLSGVILIVGASVIKEICNNNPVLEVVNVPKEFQDAGYTSDVVARMINDQIRKIDTEAKVLDRPSVVMELASDSPLSDSPLSNLQLQLPSADVSLKSAILFVREILRFPPERIVVDVTLNPSILNNPTNDGTTPGTVQLQAIVRRLGGSSPTIDQITVVDIDTTLFRIAQDVMFEADPYVLGVYLIDKHVPERSKRCFQKATELNPHDAFAFEAWGYVLQYQGKFADAIAKYRRATELNPNYARAYNDWGSLLNQQGKFVDAIAKYKKVTEISPKETPSHIGAVAYNNWGGALINQRKFVEAIPKFEKATELDPRLDLAYNNWGFALFERGKFADAITKYQQAVTLKPELDVAYINWGQALLAEGKSADAVAQFKQATEVNPEDATAYFNWGYALNEQGKFDAASIKFHQATELNPELAGAYNNWGVALVNQGKFADAFAKYHQATDINPKFAEAYYDWGVALDFQGKFAAAIAKYQQAISLNPELAAVYWYSVAYKSLAEQVQLNWVLPSS